MALNVVNLYNKINDSKITKFSNNLSSNLRVISSKDQVDCDFKWLELMEETIPYIDNILRAPNRFIVNEEDVIKIELAKRVTVESIKHLSRNTNLIQEYDKKTGDVKPSKILNITKEESYDTYENRLIYSLIQNMKLYITMKKRDMVYETSVKSDKSFEYNGNANIGKEKLNITMNINSSYNNTNKVLNSEGIGIEERLEKLDIEIASLTNSDVYKTIEKKHIALVTPPIKKTNLIIKNVNFQYAMILWDFLHSNVEDSVSKKSDKKDYNDNGELKNMVDETFLLNYLVLDSIDNTDISNEKEEIQEKIVGNMVSQVMNVNSNITAEELKDIVDKQFTVIKYKSVVSDTNIKKIFKKSIDKYLDKIIGLKI